MRFLSVRRDSTFDVAMGNDGEMYSVMHLSDYIRPELFGVGLPKSWQFLVRLYFWRHKVRYADR